MKEKNIYVSNTPLADAREQWQEALASSGFFSMDNSELVHPRDSLGRVTAEPVFAGHSAPSYNAAAMDGITVNFKDLTSASEANPVRLSGGNFQPVNTGNAIPPQFDAVVMIEDVHYLSPTEVELIAPATPWQHVRNIGEDIVATELILPQGHKIRPVDIGAMLATGTIRINVKKIPMVLVIPTGSELIQPGTIPEAGQIIEFNSHILSGYLQEWGAHPVRSLPVNDDPDILEETILSAVKTHDLVILNAGASAGTKDFTSSVLEKIGEIVVHGIAIKPGKPVILAMVNGTPVVGLPGYPVSAILTMRLFVRDMIYGFLGLPEPKSLVTKATMSRPVYSSMGVDQVVRVTLGNVGTTLMATPSGKGAGAVMSLVKADGLLTIGSGNEGVGAGEEVSIELLRPQHEIDATLVMIGSHDNIIDLLANELHKKRPILRISSAHVGSMGGIMAIRRGEAHLAGCHLLDEESGEYNIPFIKRLLGDMPLRLVNLCYRQQGFIVPKGNPENITSFTDIINRQLTFINRQGGSGTRLLTDKILQDLELDHSQIEGYEREEFTHMAVAAAVASTSAHCGMGIKAAAVALDLDFIPVAEERYDLIIPELFYNNGMITTVLELIGKESKFTDKIIGLGGYNLRDCGKIMYQQ